MPLIKLPDTMMHSITFIGDVHGKVNEYLHLIAGVERSVQVGDFGFGFVEVPEFDTSRHRIVRGNHDNPALADAHPASAFGFLDDLGVFCVPGAQSIDKHLRHDGIDWWREEELSAEHANILAERYELYRREIRIVVSHDCPSVVWKRFSSGERRSPTVQLLDHMWSVHQPHYWIFGHHHRSVRETIAGTQFIGLAELESITLQIEDVPCELKN